jgi:hypothetical protein
LSNDKPFLTIQQENFERDPYTLISEDWKFVKGKLSSATPTDPYWYCVPRDCVELNGIIMAYIVSRLLKRPYTKIYNNVIAPTDKSWATHTVISNRYVEPGSVLSPAAGEADIVIFDLIHPMIPRMYELVKKSKITIIGSDSVAMNWNDMGYANYPGIQKIMPWWYAGVLPYYFHKGQLYIILGREKYEANWDGSEKYSDFGGGPEEEDQKDPKRTAARECYQESMGIFGTADEIYKKLKDPVEIVQGGKVVGYTYLLHLVDGYNRAKIFNTVYDYVKKCKMTCPEGWMEKTWTVVFSKNDLLTYLAQKPEVFRPQFIKSVYQVLQHGKFVQ